MSSFGVDSTKGEPFSRYCTVLLGREESGKTSILNRLVSDRRRQLSAVHFDGQGYAEKMALDKDLQQLYVWDLFGGSPVSEFWDHYINSGQTHGLIYVVDGTNFREPEDRQLLWSVFEPNDLRGIPILLFVNKRDLPQYGNVDEIVDSLNMHNFRNRLWHVQSCSAVTGEGIREGLLELYQMIRHHRKA